VVLAGLDSVKKQLANYGNFATGLISVLLKGPPGKE
jgi:hypothetical protein